MTFCSFHTMASSMIYYSTYAWQMFYQMIYTEIMFCCCMTSFVIYTLIMHAQEPMKLLHLYELLYNN